MKNDDIYLAFGKLLNNRGNQQYFYDGKRDLLFFACNESENRPNECRDFFGTFCIKSQKTEKRLLDTVLEKCNLAVEKQRTLKSYMVEVNIFSNEDNAIDIMSDIQDFLSFVSVKEKLESGGVNIYSMKQINRIDEIVKNRYEYRANFTLEIRTCSYLQGMPLQTFNQIDWSISKCANLKSEGKVKRGESFCKS